MRMREAFTRAYTDARWHNGSGPGSGEAETGIWREFLAAYLRKHRIRSVLDLGCGDWQHSRLIDWTGIAYHGIDVVPEVITANTAAYGGPGITFQCADITTCPLPGAELIICKEVLQHWPLADIQQFRKRVMWRRKVLIVNDCLPLVANVDIDPGGYRPLDFTEPPLASWRVRELLRWTLAYPDGTREIKVVHSL
jgi:SAM-dependent methyltransferase